MSTDALSQKQHDFIKAQPMFFVATAASEGSVNLSPKGLDTLRIVDEKRLVWLNLSGSGNETAAHILEAPRMTMMFMALAGDALILRLYGTAKVVHPRDTEWDELVSLFPEMAGSRQIFDFQLERTQESCGSGVPKLDFVEGRGEVELEPYFAKKGPEWVDKFWRKKNAISIDGKTTGLFED